METLTKITKLIPQLLLIILITQAGNFIQQVLHIPLAGSIVGLILFFCLLQTGIIKSSWVNDGANFLLATMIFFFLPSIIGVEEVVGEINLNYILFFLLVVVGTVVVAFASGYIAEKMTKEGPLS